MQLKHTFGLIAVGTAFVALPAVASANHIDFFSDGAVNLQLTPGQTQQSSFSTNPAGDTIIGSGRGTKIEFAPGASTGVISATLIGEGTRANGSDTGQLVFSNSATTMGMLTLDYGTFTNFNVVNAPTNYTSFDVNVAAIQPNGSYTVMATVTDTDGDTSSQTQTIGGPGVTSFAYSSFGSNIDFTSIDRLQFKFTALSPGADLTLNEIVRGFAVPEPTTLGLAGVAVVGLLGRRRRM